MGQISQELVETIWKEVSDFSSGRTEKEFERAAQRQPDLLTFVSVFTEELSPEAHGLATYLFFVIQRIFEQGTKRRIRRVGGPQIERQLEQNEKMLARLEHAHPRFFERVALTEASKQPHVVQYLVEEIMEAADEEDPIDLTEEEEGTLFLVLKTVIDVLDQARRKAETIQKSSVPIGEDRGISK